MGFGVVPRRVILTGEKKKTVIFMQTSERLLELKYKYPGKALPLSNLREATAFLRHYF
jgi:hypothetical protein